MISWGLVSAAFVFTRGPISILEPLSQVSVQVL